MKEFWVNGETIDKEAYIGDLRFKITKKQSQIAECEKLIEFVDKAIEEHFATVFKPLNKALKEFGNLEQMHNMYGFGAVSKARYEKVCNMAEEQEKLKDTILQFDLTYKIKQKIHDLNFEIDGLQAALDYATKVDEVES